MFGMVDAFDQARGFEIGQYGGQRLGAFAKRNVADGPGFGERHFVQKA